VDVLATVRQTIDRYSLLAGGGTVVVGVSGGPDSLCLLHILNRLRKDYGIELHVAHLDHRIRGWESQEDAAFVARLAEEWGLPATIEARDVPRLARESKLAIEEAARQARYSFLAQVALAVGAKRIAVGHNADDQVETIVMHWLRGAGLAGLRGMLPLTELGEMRLEAAWPDHPPLDLQLIRPLLETPRVEIEAYCQEHGLKPRFDRSNLDTTYYRNRLRHELIPYLESFNPGIREVLRRSAQVISDDYEFLRAELERVWSTVVSSESGEAIAFDLNRWRALSTSLQRSILREAVHRLRRSLRNINWIHIENALWALRDKPAGTRVTLPQGLMLTIGYHDFTVANEGYVPEVDWPLLFVESLPVAVPGVTELPNSGWCLEATILGRGELGEDYLDNPNPWQTFLDYDKTGSELMLRQRRSGDRFQPLGLGGHEKSLHTFMIDHKIPRSLRDFVPIVASPRHIIWVAGWRIDERVKITASTKRILHLAFRSDVGRVANPTYNALQQTRQTGT
jgi:tRNA(Ile)-lysidine synthase